MTGPAALSIRSKMIATSALLIAFVVALFGYVANSRVQKDLGDSQTRVSQRRLEAMQQSGVSGNSCLNRSSNATACPWPSVKHSS